MFLIGAAIIAYPWITRPFNLIEENNEIENYYEMVEDLSPELEEKLINEYEHYNSILVGEDIDGDFDEIDGIDQENETSDDDIYINKRDGFTNGRLLGTIEVPKLNIKIPIYQGATQDNLRKGAGQISGTSLPIGEPGTHSVLAGHNRFRNKELFTNIHKLKVGDSFKIDSLGKQMEYKVVDTIVVEPYETDYLLPVEGKDKVTLLTCTYFGKKRLLIMGERSE